MKVEQAQEFAPVTIKLETRDDLHRLIICMNSAAKHCEPDTYKAFAKDLAAALNRMEK
jgi:hypothetical protein